MPATAAMRPELSGPMYLNRGRSPPGGVCPNGRPAKAAATRVAAQKQPARNLGDGFEDRIEDDIGNRSFTDRRAGPIDFPNRAIIALRNENAKKLLRPWIMSP